MKPTAIEIACGVLWLACLGLGGLAIQEHGHHMYWKAYAQETAKSKVEQ